MKDDLTIKYQWRVYNSPNYEGLFEIHEQFIGDYPSNTVVYKDVPEYLVDALIEERKNVIESLISRAVERMTKCSF